MAGTLLIHPVLGGPSSLQAFLLRRLPPQDTIPASFHAQASSPLWPSRDLLAQKENTATCQQGAVTDEIPCPFPLEGFIAKGREGQLW